MTNDMKGDFVRPKRSIYYEDECLVDSTILYRILGVFHDGVAYAIPASDSNETRDNVRLFHLCAVHENEVI